MSFFIPAAVAQTAEGAAPMGGGFEWIFLVGFLVIFYLMIWRPQAKRAKEHKNLIGGLTVGDEVVTGGGLVGKAVKVDDEYVEVEIANGVRVKAIKATLTDVMPRGGAKPAND